MVVVGGEQVPRMVSPVVVVIVTTTTCHRAVVVMMVRERVMIRTQTQFLSPILGLRKT